MKTLKLMEVPATQLSIVYLHYGYDVLELLHRPTPSRPVRSTAISRCAWTVSTRP